MPAGAAHFTCPLRRRGLDGRRPRTRRLRFRGWRRPAPPRIKNDASTVSRIVCCIARRPCTCGPYKLAGGFSETNHSSVEQRQCANDPRGMHPARIHFDSPRPQEGYASMMGRIHHTGGQGSRLGDRPHQAEDSGRRRQRLHHQRRTGTGQGVKPSQVLPRCHPRNTRSQSDM